MKLRSGISVFAGILLLSFLLSNCMNEKGIPDYKGFPDDIGKLINTKCATPGCHTNASREAASGLSLESFDELFKGGRGGAVVIPYRSDYSTLFFYCNTYSDLGITLTPTMPYNEQPLTREEVLMLKNWIDMGAPSRDGYVKFSENPNRKKYYVPNQGCDVVTVFDQESGLPMRYVNVGQSAADERPHMIKVSPDGQYWYVVFTNGNYFEKYRCSDDSFVGAANIGSGNWNAFALTNDSAYCTDFNASPAKIAFVELSTMTAYTGTAGGWNYLHGVATVPGKDNLLVTEQFGTVLFSIKANEPDQGATDTIHLYGASIPSLLINPHEIAYSPDNSKYFVTCQGTSDVRVMDAATDQLVGIIPLHYACTPTEMAFSTTGHYLFVTCTEDTLNIAGKRGSVAVIDYTTNTLLQYIYTGHQPHGIAVDEAKKLVVVANRNSSTDGPAPHHASSCGGRNGYVSYIDLNTLQMVTNPGTGSVRKIELSVDPYSVGIR